MDTLASRVRHSATLRAVLAASRLVAGLVITAMLVPVGIAYAEASGLPGINGLYATIVPLLVYALFGPSRILVLGPDSSLAAVIVSVVLPLSTCSHIAWSDGCCFGHPMHCCRVSAPWFRH